MSQSSTKSGRSAGAPPPEAAAANVGAEKFTVAVGTPIASRSAVSGEPLNCANVPGLSVTRRCWASAEVSVYEAGTPAEGVEKEALPACTDAESATRESDPDRKSRCVLPNGYAPASPYAGVASPLYGTQSRQ